MALAEVDVQTSQAGHPEPQRGNRIITSAAAELFWALFVLAGDKKMAGHHVEIPEAVARRLQGRIQQFWNDGSTCYTELVVLAGRGGHLEDESNDALLASIPRLSTLPLERGIMRSETPADLAMIRGRLKTLRTDA